MITRKRKTISLPLWLITMALLAGLFPWTGGVRAEPPQPTPTPTRAPFAFGVSFLGPDGQVGTTYRGIPDSASATTTADPSELTAQALARINDLRQADGLPPLLANQALTVAASEHANDLQSSGAFQHRGSDGSWPADRATRQGHPTAYLGENLAVGYVSAQAAVDAWLADNGCRVNLLDPRFTQAGLAFAHNGPWHNYWVLMLGDQPAYRPGRVLIKFQPAVTAASIQHALTQVNATSLGKIGHLDVERLAVPVGQEAAVIAALGQNPNVAFVELDRQVQATLEPDDPGYADRWWWEQIRAADAWDVTTGSDTVIIAVVDTGVDMDHPDLAAKIVSGYDFVNGDADPDDDHGHGTHVAGIAAAVTNNTLGVAGLSWGARIMPLKVLNSAGSGYASDVAAAITYAADNGAQVVNLSLGDSQSSGTLTAATDYAHDAGVFIAAAAGNDGQNILFYPAANEHVVGVAATTSADTRASFSNYAAHVDVAAPGSSIYSAIPGSYNYKSGTSMATPFVSGLAALVLSTNSTLTPDEVQAIIEQTADDLGDAGRDDEYGWGRINAYQAVLLASQRALDGTVYDQQGHGMAGVSLSIVGSQTFTATTDGDGHFSRTDLSEDTYTLTPSLADLAFSPPARTVVITDSHVTGITFTAQVSTTFSISGTIRTDGGQASPDVHIVIASDHLRLTTQTDNHGSFTQTGLISDTYTVTPALGSTNFEPPTRTIVITDTDQSAANFIQNSFPAYLPLVSRNAASAIFPDDPHFDSGAQWGLHNTGQSGGTDDADIDAPEGWGLSTGDSSVIVAIVDTGVDMDHTEFSGRLVDGRDFANDDSNPDDDHGHGTHVAGIAAAAGNNAAGVAGVAWNVRIMPLKVLDADGSGYNSDVANAITYAVNHDAKVVNMSLGGTGYSQAVQDAMTYAYNNGVLVVAAAGNCGDSNYYLNGCSYQDQPNYPAAGSHVLAVASTTRWDSQSSFSNQNAYVDIAAPGSSIYSTAMGGGYTSMSGTSMATPFVAGLAGLICSKYPSYSPAQVAQAIVHNANDLGAPGHDDLYGCGRINAYHSLINGALSGGCSGWSGLSVSIQAASTPPTGAEFRPGALLIRFRDTASLAERENVMANHNLTVLHTIAGLEIHRVAVPQGQEAALMESLNADPAIAYAELDYKVYALPFQPESRN